ncbi:hypothetical protein JR316_0002743 [Psilocybe cubensis]|uniref:Uncharacterized protein n=1 Tax=Psilocybe cubensis TaxID=181762 RepID=A0ACB8HD31_PSICU|nr:hypothetical protein JR316_0002743 [Psilocybe cubensis]KAH9485828.1 hypothetical protein JR316_0002743 [Psilocybe cubensis]
MDAQMADTEKGTQSTIGSGPTSPSITIDNSASSENESHLESHHIPCFCVPLSNQRFGRNLVVTIDGTANQFGLKNTNIVELYSRLVKDEGQLTYYNSGIGTYVPDSASWASFSQFISHQWDKAFASNFKTRVLKAYAWLSENYKQGDRIFLFGFSRGAYQVRVIAGMIEKVGLLHKGNTEQIPFAYDLYIATLKRKMPGAPTTSISTERPYEKSAAKGRPKETPEHLCRQFKKSLSNDKVVVHFVGSWDTVSSVGALRSECLPETTTGMEHVCAFRHALALDELRVKFLPEYANGGAGPPDRDSEPVQNEAKETVVQHAERSTMTKRGNIKEVWFAGSHSDVGGGNDDNPENDQFGPSLRWMTYEAILWGLRMKPFHKEWVPPKSRSSMTLVWTILEGLPISHLSYRDASSVTRRPHLKSPRLIQPGQLIHASVFELMHQEPGYRPKAQFSDKTKWDSALSTYLESTRDTKTLKANNIENDPYIQPSKILDTIAKRRHKVKTADYDQLLKLSFTETYNAEHILARALADESKEEPVSEATFRRIATIAKIMDRCFDIIPAEFLENYSEPPASAWEILNQLYPEHSSSRSKFLHRFANRDARLKQVEEEVDTYSRALQGKPQPARHVRLEYIKKLVVGLLDSLVLANQQPTKLSEHLHTCLPTYKQALRFLELSYSDRSALIKTLAKEIDSNFACGGEGFLDERIALFKSSFELIPTDSANQEDHLQDLLPALYQRFEETSQHEDIDEILSYNSEIQGLLSAWQPHPVASNLAATLASSCMVRFKLTSEFHYIDEALSHLQGSILNCPASDPNRADLYVIQGDWCHLRFKETGQVSYLDQADQSYHRAISIRRVYEQKDSYPKTKEAAILCDRFKLTRQRSFLDNAINFHRSSLPLISTRPHELASASFDFADALLTLFVETGEFCHLNEAIEHYESALIFNKKPRFSRAKCLNGLGVALRKRFEINRQYVDLARAIELHEEALTLCPEPYIERDNCFSGLASAFATRYSSSNQRSDYNKAVEQYHNALLLLPPSHPSRTVSLVGLATILQKPYETTNQRNVLQQATTLFRDALLLLPSHHVERADALFGLAAVLRSQFDLCFQESLQNNPRNSTKRHDTIDDSPPSYTEQLMNSFSFQVALQHYRAPLTHRGHVFNTVGLASSFQSLKLKTAPLSKATTLESSHSIDTPTSSTPLALDNPSPTGTINGADANYQSITADASFAFLDEAIKLLKETLPLRPFPHPARVESLSLLVDILERRSGNTDQAELLAYRHELANLRKSGESSGL